MQICGPQSRILKDDYMRKSCVQATRFLWSFSGRAHNLYTARLFVGKLGAHKCGFLPTFKHRLATYFSTLLQLHLRLLLTRFSTLYTGSITTITI
jgi:hypothetical protein